MRNDLDSLPARIVELARQRIRPGEDEWKAIEQTTHELVAPAIAAHGVENVVSALLTAKADPYVAAVLVDMSGVGRAPSDRDLRATELFSDDEIIEGALSYLKASPGAGLENGDWAWTTLWNLWGQLEPDAHVRLVRRVIELVPWDDRMLWMIGDGPLANLADDPASLQAVESTTTEEKVNRIRRLVQVDWPHGSVDN